MLDPLKSFDVFSTRRTEDVSSIVVFRVVYGLICTVLASLFLLTSFVDEWLMSCNVELHWVGLEWLSLPCDPFMLRVVVGITALAGLGVTLGAFYRWSAAVLVGMLIYALLAEQAIYSSTYYLLCLFGLWLVFAPADRAWSIDAKFRGRGQPSGPAWPLAMLRFHAALMYVYAAIAKLDGDWLAGRPVDIWLQQKSEMPLIGSLLTTPGLGVSMAWGGLLLDALIVPALLHRRTRGIAFTIALLFHAWNGLVFSVFPLPIVAIAATTLFFEPDWPRRFWGRLRGRGALIPPTPAVSGPRRSVMTGVLLAYVAAHLLLPFRHHLYPGPVAWNEDGDEFSWRLRARTKKKKLIIRIVDRATGTREKPDGELHWLKVRAVRAYPDRLLQYTHQLREREEARGRGVEVVVRYRVGLNGRRPRDLVPRGLDLSRQPRTWLNSEWILPLEDR